LPVIGSILELPNYHIALAKVSACTPAYSQKGQDPNDAYDLEKQPRTHLEICKDKGMLAFYLSEHF